MWQHKGGWELAPQTRIFQNAPLLKQTSQRLLSMSGNDGAHCLSNPEVPFHLLRSLSTVLQTGCTDFQSPQPCTGVPFLHTLSCSCYSPGPLPICAWSLPLQDPQPPTTSLLRALTAVVTSGLCPTFQTFLCFSGNLSPFRQQLEICHMNQAYAISGS